MSASLDCAGLGLRTPGAVQPAGGSLSRAGLILAAELPQEFCPMLMGQRGVMKVSAALRGSCRTLIEINRVLRTTARPRPLGVQQFGHVQEVRPISRPATQVAVTLRGRAREAPAQRASRGAD